jgi:hypothetical protein
VIAKESRKVLSFELTTDYTDGTDLNCF